jgi:Tfp pilus assembly protein PilW
MLRGGIDIRDERGMTLVELMVATATGVVVMGGITLAMIVTMRETSRVAGHVEADQQARQAMTKLLGELHSACVAPQIAPIYPESTGSAMTFIHQSGSAVAPVPVKTRVSLVGGNLVENDFAYEKGTAPNWTFKTTSTSEILTYGIEPMGTTPLFRYYSYANGAISTTPLSSAPELGENAARTVQVSIAFNANPANAVSNDASSQTGIQDSALLRLTPPAYSSASSNSPCQ